MIGNTFQLPKLIADSVTEKRPRAINQGDKKLKDYLLGMLTTSGFYDDKYTADKEVQNIYLNTTHEDTISSTSTYTITAVSRLIGVEPNIHYLYEIAHLNPTPILTFSTGIGSRVRLVLMGNSFLRAHFSLGSLASYERIRELITSSTGKSFPFDEIFGRDVLNIINITRNLSTLYRDLMVENHEDGFFSTLSEPLTVNRPGLDVTGDWFYKNNMTYVVSAMAVATMVNIYNNICGPEEAMGHVEKTSMRNIIDSLVAVTLIDNTFKDRYSQDFIDELTGDHEVVKKLVEILTSADVASNRKDFLSIIADVAYCIASVERRTI